MPGSWGRPPRNEIWQDLQALAVWVVIIGVVGYLLFPGFFKDVYLRLTDPSLETVTETGLNYTLPSDSNSFANPSYPSYPSQQFPISVTDALYNNKSEISSGYWIMFVADGEFKQLSVTSDSYAFLLRLIDKDQKGVVKNTLILAANGQVKKFVVTDELYTIITNIAAIEARTRS